MTTVQKLLASAAVVFPAAMAIAPSVAYATPYAFASNQITGLTIKNADGTALTGVTSATTVASDAAQFGTLSDAHQGSGLVGNAVTIPQAYAGPGPAPAAIYTAVGPGNFTGTRADAAIDAGSASSGGVGVRNVAEGFGSSLGSSTGNNAATITFHVTGTGQAVQLSFTDAFALTASTAANAQETANASISNEFSVTPSGSSTPIFLDNPGAVNLHLSSQDGVPPSNSASGSPSLTITSPVLVTGTAYDITLFSSSTESILPGGTTPVPEPASIAILGVGLLGLGLTFRRKRS